MDCLKFNQVSLAFCINYTVKGTLIIQNGEHEASGVLTCLHSHQKRLHNVWLNFLKTLYFIVS